MRKNRRRNFYLFFGLSPSRFDLDLFFAPFWQPLQPFWFCNIT